jgi:iron complex outermembrane recepter protein
MNRSSSTLGAALLGVSISVSAVAADISADMGASDTLQEIVVTAQKRSEDLQKIPVAVTAESGDTLVQQGVTDVRDLAQLIPAIELGQDYIYTQIDIRGVGANNDAPALDPAIAFNVDGVYQPRDYGTYGAFYDISSVEVLRGPQGTLYGRNTTGGSINLITNKPVQQFQAAMDLDFGNYDTKRGFGMLNLPVTDDLAVRGALQYSSHDGYLTSGFDDQDSIASRLQALYKPNADFSLLVGADYFYDHSIGNHTVIGLPYVQPSDPWFDDASTAGAHSDFKTYSLHSQLDWTFGGVTLTDIPSYKRVDINSTDPVVGVFSTTISTDKSYSNELRLASATDPKSPWTWVAGLYLFEETDYSYADYFNPFFSSITINPDIAEKSGALFGQTTYTIQEGLRVTGGLRYSVDSKTANGQDQIFIPALPFPVGNIPDIFSKTWHNVDWKVGFDTDITPTSLLYASIGTGYLEGGFNLGSTVGLLPNFEPEKLLAYTVGSKNRLFNDRFQVNVEAFYYDYKDYIVSEYLTQGAAAGDFALYNANKTRIYGSEIETEFLATEQDLFNVSLALLHGEYTNFTLPVASNGLTNLSGFTAMKSPSASIQAGFQHTWNVGNGAQIRANITTHFDSSYWTLFDHTPGSAQPSYTKTNIVLTYTAPNNRWHVQLYGNNLENTAVIATAAPPNSSSGTVPWVNVEPPRLFGGRVGFNF